MNTILHVAKFYLSDGVTQCEIIIYENDENQTPHFHVVKFGTLEDVCVVKIFEPEYLEGTTLRISDDDAKNLDVIVSSDYTEYPINDIMNMWRTIRADWLCSNECEDDYDSDNDSHTCPDYTKLNK